MSRVKEEANSPPTTIPTNTIEVWDPLETVFVCRLLSLALKSNFRGVEGGF